MKKICHLLALIALPAMGQTAGQNAVKTSWQSRLPSDPPLSGSQRAALFFHNDFASTGALLRTVVPAIASQLNNTPPDWNKTGEGFGRRVGLNFVMSTSQDLVQSGSAALFGHDPRYQRCDCKGGLRRVGYAVSGLFLLADSGGVRRFDPSNLIGAYGSGYLGASLYPARYSLEVKGPQLGHQQAGFVAAKNLFLEFSPDIKRFLRRKVLGRP